MLFIDTCKLYLVNWLRIWGPKMWILLFQTISLTSLFLSTLILTPVFLTHLTVNHNISSSSLYFSTWHIIPTVAWQYWVLVLNIIIITVGTTTTIRTSNPYAPSCMRGRKKKKKIPGEGSGYPLQYSCLENSMDRGAWWAAVHGITKELDMTERLTLLLSKKWRIWLNILFYDRKSLVIPKVVMLIFYDPKDWNVPLSDIVSHLSQFWGHFYCPNSILLVGVFLRLWQFK